ncbi:hypothetical protein [Sphingobacterium sp. T2]|uniref:hypothetical protein n=1 Tax=Sphingobacterium sp. T2 TaxID=1590596 RepID=UPI00057BC714|nr:hypothetical protein [Sphingobacterium sp. T2]
MFLEIIRKNRKKPKGECPNKGLSALSLHHSHNHSLSSNQLPQIVEKSVYTKLEKTALIEESMPEEVLALKRSRELKEKEKTIKLHKAQQAQKETVEKEKIFDLRTAIIQSAILERPYQ